MTDTPPPSPTDPAPGTPDPADAEKNKVMALLAYLGPLVLVPLLAAKDSPFARYHTNQGLVLLITGIGLGVCVAIVWVIAIFIPFIGWCVGCVAYVAVLVSIITLAIMGIINAVNGRMKPLPVIGKYKLLK